MVHILGPALRWFGSRKLFTGSLVVVVGVSLLSSAVVMASIPASNGTIYACRNAFLAGLIRVIDSPSQSCNSSYETPLNFAGGTPAFVANLVGADFNGIDLRYRDFSSANLTDADFRNSTLTGADFAGANLTNANFQSAYAKGASFVGVTLSPSMLGGLTEFLLSDFTNTNLSGQNFSNAHLRGSNFSGANLTNNTLQHVDFTNEGNQSTTFTNVDFSNTSFYEVNLTGASLATATLTGASWDNTYCPDGTYSDSNGNTCIGHLSP